MDFFGIGPMEVLVIIIVALILFGPERLVDMGKTAGKTMRTFRKAASDLTTQVTKEIEEAKAAVTVDLEDKPTAALPTSAATTTAAPEIPAANNAKHTANQDGTATH